MLLLPLVNFWLAQDSLLPAILLQRALLAILLQHALLAILLQHALLDSPLDAPLDFPRDAPLNSPIIVPRDALIVLHDPLFHDAHVLHVPFAHALLFRGLFDLHDANLDDRHQSRHQSIQSLHSN